MEVLPLSDKPVFAKYSRANPRTAVGLAVLLALAGPASGCSFLFVTRPPPPAERGRNFDCTSSNVAPVIDTLIAGWQVIRTVIALSAPESAYTNAPLSRGADIGVGIGLLGLFAASAGTGYNATSECREALADSEPPSYRPRPRPSSWKPAPPPPAPTAATDEDAAEQAKAAGAAAHSSAGATGPVPGATGPTSPAPPPPAAAPRPVSPAAPPSPPRPTTPTAPQRTDPE
jgi:hypothetical protein